MPAGRAFRSIRAFWRALARPLGTLPSGAEGDVGGPRPIAVSHIWSHSKGEGEEWLYLRLLQPGEETGGKIRDIQRPAPDTRCALQGVGAFVVTIDWPPVLAPQHPSLALKNRIKL